MGSDEARHGFQTAVMPLKPSTVLCNVMTAVRRLRVRRCVGGAIAHCTCCHTAAAPRPTVSWRQWMTSSTAVSPDIRQLLHVSLTLLSHVSHSAGAVEVITPSTDSTPRCVPALRQLRARSAPLMWTLPLPQHPPLQPDSIVQLTSRLSLVVHVSTAADARRTRHAGRPSSVMFFRRA